jgi:CRISPR-associated RAMP protein (TIGR02581 family)
MVEQEQGIEMEARYELRNRYHFTGKLVMSTALHIGGGRASLSPSDSPVILTLGGEPFIPGSSFKGALRSTIEKLVPDLPKQARLSSCALIDLPEEIQIEETRKEGGEKSCPTVRQRGIVKVRREWQQQGKHFDFDKMERKYICSTCRLFGSPFAAARLNIADLYLDTSSWSGGIEIRDGVAIDRDSETAKDRLKYDFEVVPANVTFNLSIILENATPKDLQLISIGLNEFVQGYGMLGGKRSRGLGFCKLQDLKVAILDLADENKSDNLKNYLLHHKFSDEKSGLEFINQHIAQIFQSATN